MNIFTSSITEWESDAAPPSKVNEASYDDSVVTFEAPETPEAKKVGKTKQVSAKTAAAEAKKPGKAKQASAKTAAAETLASIAVNCYNVLAFL